MAEKLSFQTNIAETVVLRFPDGLESEGRFGTQYMYSLEDGRVMYVPDVVDAKLHELAIAPGEPVIICKKEVREGRGKPVTRWQVSRPEGGAPEATPGPIQPQRPDPTPAAATAARTIPGSTTSDNNTQHANTTLTLSAGDPVPTMSAALCAAIDVLIEAEQYAATKGMKLAFHEEDVRAMANTFFIQAGKEAENLLKYRTSTAPRSHVNGNGNNGSNGSASNGTSNGTSNGHGPTPAQQAVAERKIASLRNAPPQPKPPLSARPWKTTGEMLSLFQSIRESVGEVTYNEYLQRAGVDNARQFTSSQQACDCYCALAGAIRQEGAA